MIIEEGRRKKWTETQTTRNFKHYVDGGILNSKEKDNIISA
ncbi:MULTISPECIES: hypothetical protein [Okeania]|nr:MULTISPECIES: hypothetical protein [Okeania]